MIGSKHYANLKYREVKGRRMAYIDEGDGDAIRISSTVSRHRLIVWRNCHAGLEGMGRLVACDLIAWAARTSSTRRWGRTAIAS